MCVDISYKPLKLFIMITQNVFIDKQTDWIKNNSNLKFANNSKVLEITTPFLDRHNDYIQLYIISKKKEIIISDDGFTYADLIMSGIVINSLDTKQNLGNILQNYGVGVRKNNELFITTKYNNLIENEHKLIQSIVAINNLFNFPYNNDEKH